ncbi:unnamed protein product [Miscanthus lutarioriparius]|uniref:F-box domain-containing protein n=1 Tax=Miscanthus lutarioriparius TaxID=422564 RepID=A0A811ND31_9POAL|nr:unnamed protein product [Miscanthus lutarioriparius]
MDCPKTESGEVAVACPPDDSLVEIFSRLPAKPLFRCKCVSKNWCGLIADRLRCRKFPQTLEGFFAGDGVESYGGFICPERPVPLVDPSFSFLTKLPEIKKIVLLDSCNGLVLFGHRRVSEKYDYSLGYIVCNPATEEWVSVPNSGWTPCPLINSDDKLNQDCDPDTYLIFDPAISPHFQLIQFQFRFGVKSYLPEVHSFSSVAGAWRLELKLKGVPGLPPGMKVDTGAACPFKGMVHVRAQHPYLPSENLNMILAVGGEGRPFRTLHWPQNDRGVLVFIGQSQGHLHCLSGCTGNSSQMTELSIWVLEDYNADKWVLRDNVSFSQLFGRMSGRFHLDWDVVAIHPDRSLVIFAEYWNCKLISYDMDKEVHALCSLHGYHRHIIPYVPYFAESAALAKKH